MKDEISRREKWTIKAHLDAQCAACRHVGADVLIEVEVESRMLVVADEPGEERYEMGFRTLTGEVPIVMHCPACRNTVKFGRAATLTTEEVSDGVETTDEG